MLLSILQHVPVFPHLPVIIMQTLGSWAFGDGSLAQGKWGRVSITFFAHVRVISSCFLRVHSTLSGVRSIQGSIKISARCVHQFKTETTPNSHLKPISLDHILKRSDKHIAQASLKLTMRLKTDLELQICVPPPSPKH